MPKVNQYTGNTEYPKQCFRVVRNKTFSVEAEMFAPEKKTAPPLEWFHKSFARFCFTLLEDGQAASANCNVKYVSYIAEQSKLCLQQELVQKLNPVVNAPSELPVQNKPKTINGNTPAFSLLFRTGPYKGKTPAQVAIMDNGKDILRGQYVELRNNLEKYPGNQNIMDAIVEAVNLLDTGSLKPEEKTTEIAYSVTFRSGNLKGKTPAQVLLEDLKGGEETLSKQKDFLSKNVAKYPANREVIDAIDAAFLLQRSGQLSAEKIETTAAASMTELSAGYVIHDADFMCHVDPKKPGYRSDELEDISHLRITWEFGRNYPVIIFIENYRATVSVGTDGRQNVGGNHVNVKAFKMALTAAEWMDCLFKMQTTMQLFTMLNAKEAFTDASLMSKENADAAKAAKASKS